MGDRDTLNSPIDSINKGDKRNFLDITALIRSIQHAEGNTECFRRGKGDCDKIDCAWHKYCVEGCQTSQREET